MKYIAKRLCDDQMYLCTTEFTEGDVVWKLPYWPRLKVEKKEGDSFFAFNQGDDRVVKWKTFDTYKPLAYIMNWGIKDGREFTEEEARKTLTLRTPV